jgi:glycopeptide antibiotics resistance protein
MLGKRVDLRRSTTALVLVAYSAILIEIVVFKGGRMVPEWARPGREERAAGRHAGGSGDAPNVRGSESNRSERNRLSPSKAPAARLSTSRFAPLHANYVPFKTILWQLRGKPSWSSAMINLVGNTVLFMPVGFLVLLVYRKMSWQSALVLAVAVGVTMEVMEGVLRVGVVDVDDVILNALGVMSGYGVCRVWMRQKDAAMVQPAGSAEGQKAERGG